MERDAGTPDGKLSRLRDWIDPTRIYDTSKPVERWPFVWGLVIYPFLVMFVLLTAAIIVMETVYSTAANLPDQLGVIIYLFMLAWVAAAVSICLRRLRFLQMSQMWILLILLPLVNLVFFAYLLIKSGPAESQRLA